VDGVRDVYRSRITAALRSDARQHRPAAGHGRGIVTAPTIRSPIRGSAEINGGFDRARAEELAKAISDAARHPSTLPAR
jgi:preprotein translocase subunit SecD